MQKEWLNYLTRKEAINALNSQAKAGFEPDWSFVDTFDYKETDPNELTIFWQFAFDNRIDGTQQMVTLFGTGEHSYNPSKQIFGDTKKATERIIQDKTDNQLATTDVFTEGERMLSNLDMQLSDEEIMKRYGEIRYFQYLLRKAGMQHIYTPEPGIDVRSMIGQVYGYAPLNDYLGARMRDQHTQMSVKPSLPGYLFEAYSAYPEIKDPDKFIIFDPHGRGLSGLLSRWHELYPEHPRFGDMSDDDPKLLDAFEIQTRHIPILQRNIPENQRTPMQKVAVAFNWQRDIAFINVALDSVGDGHDVAFGANHVHVRPMRRAIERAGGKLITDGL